jgi:hypothetical protein
MLPAANGIQALSFAPEDESGDIAFRNHLFVRADDLQQGSEYCFGGRSGGGSQVLHDRFFPNPSAGRRAVVRPSV